MTLRAFWRKPVADEPPPVAQRRDPAWVEVLLTILSWCLPGSAVVVGAMGQIALATVLMWVALGVWLRLWRGRSRRRS